MRNIRIEVVRDPMRLDDLARPWGDLARRVRACTYIQSFDWCRLCWELYHAPAHHGLVLICAWQGTRLAGIWPFVERRVLWLRALQPLGCGHGDTATPLIDPEFDTSDLADRFVRSLKTLADVANLPSIAIESPVLAGLSRPEYRSRVRTDDLYWVDSRQAASWEAFMMGYSANMRRALRSDRRKLEAFGSLSFTILETAEDRARVIEWTFAQKRIWLLRHGLRERWFEGEQSLHFLRKLSTVSDEVRGLRVFALELDGQIIASRICTLAHDSLAGLVMTFDPAYGRCSPGMLITESLLHWAHQHGLCFDMGATANELKVRWANSRQACQSQSVCFTFWGRLWRLFLGLKAALGRALKRHAG